MHRMLCTGRAVLRDRAQGCAARSLSSSHNIKLNGSITPRHKAYQLDQLNNSPKLNCTRSIYYSIGLAPAIRRDMGISLLRPVVDSPKSPNLNHQTLQKPQ
jgi:hypothetical protein